MAVFLSVFVDAELFSLMIRLLLSAPLLNTTSIFTSETEAEVPTLYVVLLLLPIVASSI